MFHRCGAILIAVIPAGGTGTRLGLKSGIKPLVGVGGKPLIHRIIESLIYAGIDEVALAIRHNLQIKDYIDSAFPKLKVTYVTRDTKNILEAVGACRETVLDSHEQRFLVLYADLVYRPGLLRSFLKGSLSLPCDMMIGVSRTRVCDFRVLVGEFGEVRSVGKSVSGTHFGAGLYLCSVETVVEIDSALIKGASGMADFTQFLVERDYTVRAYEMQDIYDVDTRAVLLLAEDYVRRIQRENNQA